MTERMITEKIMGVSFSHDGKGVFVPKDIAIHIHDSSDILQMLVKDKLRGVKNTDYKNSDMYDLILNDKDQENNLRKDQGLLLLKAQLIVNVCWLSKKTGEIRPVKTLRIIGEHETMLVTGSLSHGWFMESIDPSHIIDCLENYVDQKQTKR